MSDLGDELIRLVREEAKVDQEIEKLQRDKERLAAERTNREQVLANLGLTEQAARRAHVSFPERAIYELLKRELDVLRPETSAVVGALRSALTRRSVLWSRESAVREQILAESGEGTS